MLHTCSELISVMSKALMCLRSVIMESADKMVRREQSNHQTRTEIQAAGDNQSGSVSLSGKTN